MLPTPIPPTKVVRRFSAKRRHLLREREADGTYRTRCGQHFGTTAVQSTVRLASSIECSDCLVAAISEGKA